MPTRREGHHSIKQFLDEAGMLGFVEILQCRRRAIALAIRRDDGMNLSTILKAGAVALRRMRVPLYLSKYSKRDFTVHQHLLLCSVRELEKETWRGLRDRIEDSKAAEEHLGLKRTPHFTTPQKFLQRVPKAWLSLLLRRMVDLLVSEYYLSADATCFRLRSASMHYLERLGEAINVRDTRKSVDLLELQTGLFVATKGIPGHRHEAPHIVPMVRSLPGAREVVGDKAFDGEIIRRNLRDIGVESYIDVKGGRSSPERGLRLRTAVFKGERPDIWQEKYKRPRAFIESSYHALKAVTGEVLPGKGWMRDRYRALKYFAYDLYVLARDHKETMFSFSPFHLIQLNGGFLQTRMLETFIYGRIVRARTKRWNL